jgi:hypothetical protein
MEQAFNINVTPFQLLIGFSIQMWMIIAPIILIRKLNYLTALLQDLYDSKRETPSA